MAKPHAFLLVGLPHAGVPVLTAALEQHRDAIVAQGVRAPAKSVDEVFRAAVEVRREHRAWGLRRKDVEGTWSQLCRRVHKHPEPVVLGHELLAGASPEEIALLVDGLAGRRVHVVVVAARPDGRLGLFPDELDLASVLERWKQAVGSPDRLHVVVSDPAAPLGAWRALGRIVGFDADALPLPDPAGLEAPADAASLRLIAESGGGHVEHTELVEIAETWVDVVGAAGYDVVGDLRALVPVAEQTDAPSYDAREEVLTRALAEAVAEVGRLRERVRELERTQRKRSVRLPGVLVRGA
ncbi:hypothetical protein [Nocardioides flavescens]|uniref:Sulfotransferase family protein n=1 Tax=Nocardioides flavescens TaxID=2691959 RepID=A0A6L7EVF0_9ACTN|nr:hypothetical protein [Nocardioides flavescens]MXG89676.1 hypothetical protein [Nocardioides flavescens]